MNKLHAIRTFCVKRIAPAAAALVLAAVGGNAIAAPADGNTALSNKLTPNFIPTLKAATPTTKAKIADLLEAISLAMNDPLVTASPADIAAGALLADGLGKGRADKDKVAAQILATVVTEELLDGNDPDVAGIAAALFSVNSATPKAALAAAGQAAVVAQAVKVSDATESATIGTQIGAVYTGSAETLLTGTAKALATSSLAVNDSLAAFVSTFLNSEVPTGQKTFILTAAGKVASSNPPAAGAFIGGYAINNPTEFDTNAEIVSFLSDNSILTKMKKAAGDVVANISGNSADSVATLADTLITTQKDQTLKAQLAQGLLRANGSGDVASILSSNVLLGVTDRAKFGSVAAIGTGDDLAKVAAISTRLVSGLDLTKGAATTTAVIDAASKLDAAAGDAAMDSALTALNLTNPDARVTFGQNVVSKLKNYQAAGYAASSIIDANTSGGSPVNYTTAITQTGLLLAKGTKAATDIARQVSTLSFIGGASKTTAQFADDLSDNSKKFVQNIAVGVSAADPANSDQITANAITHDPIGDKAALGKAAVIAGAAAAVVDEERVGGIAAEVSNRMSIKGATAGKPISITLVATTATNLAKAIQSKPGVTLVERMDELGELSAALVKNVIGKNGSDSKGLAAEVKMITSIGQAIVKSLSKVPRLAADPTTNVASALVTTATSLTADLWEARDIAGSIAQTVMANITDVNQRAAILGTTNNAATGALAKALLPLSGKKGSLTYNAVINAINSVLDGSSGTKFEVGNDYETGVDNRRG